MSFRRFLVASVLLAAIAYTHAETLKPNTPGCANQTKIFNKFDDSKATRTSIHKGLYLWQGVLLIVCFGAFSLFISLIYRIIRMYIFYDSHLLDTFFDAGGDVNFALGAATIVAKWTWASALLGSVTKTIQYGVVGAFWYAAGGAVQLFLFSIVAAELRIKAPGAKTFLQVIKVRFGTVSHITFMIFAFICNILVSAMLMLGGITVMTTLVEDLSVEVATIIVTIVVGVYTVIGGLGATMYVAYFSCIIIMAGVLVYFCDIFYDPLRRPSNDLGSVDLVYNRVACFVGPDMSEGNSMVTFLSRSGLMYGVLHVISNFGTIFVDQSYWQSAVASKPSHSTWGFLFGGLSWFAVPIAMATSVGLGYLSFGVADGYYMLDSATLNQGMATLAVSQRMMGVTGDFLVYVMIMVAVITTASAEVLSSSSIILYDIYQTYISPFNPAPFPEDKEISPRMQRAIRTEEYLEYEKRCNVFKHVIVVVMSALLIPITLIFYAIGVNLYWLYLFMGIMVGSCVIPICLSVTWHRVTGAGMVSGALGGFIIGFVAWLVLASTEPGGLRDFVANTGKLLPMLVGHCCAIGVGGLFCIIVSLSCGGCDSGLLEEDEWDMTSRIDNPISPWAVRYAGDLGETTLPRANRPTLNRVRKSFYNAELVAYVVGVFLAVCFVLVWPAAMLPTDIFNRFTFWVWVLFILVYTAVFTGFLVFFPLVLEIAQICRQAYYNRMWAKVDDRDRLSTIDDWQEKRSNLYDSVDAEEKKRASGLENQAYESDLGSERGKGSYNLEERDGGDVLADELYATPNKGPTPGPSYEEPNFNNTTDSGITEITVSAEAAAP